MSSVPAWIPLASAGAALVGGLAGAMLQGTFSVRGWRRQTRLEAYTKFLDAEHEFHNSVLIALRSHGTDLFTEKWDAVINAELLLGRAGSLVSIAGPVASNDAAELVVDKTRALVAGIYDADALERAAADVMKQGGYQNLVEWIAAADAFQVTARRVLKTERGRT
jgi:hypothetical protein